MGLSCYQLLLLLPGTSHFFPQTKDTILRLFLLQTIDNIMLSFISPTGTRPYHRPHTVLGKPGKVPDGRSSSLKQGTDIKKTITTDHDMYCMISFI